LRQHKPAYRAAVKNVPVMKLRAKTSILIASLSVLLIAAVAAASLRYQERALRDKILAGVEAVAGTASLSIENFVRDGRNSAALVAAAVPRRALAERADRAELERFLESSVQLVPRFRNGLFMLDADGRFMTDYPPHPELRGESFAHRDYYQRAMLEHGGVISQPYLSKRTGKPVITFAVRIIGDNGKTLGVLGCSVDLLASDALGPVVRQRIGTNGYLYVMDHTRQMILHPDESRLLKRDVPPGANQLLDAAIGGFQGAGETVNSRGVTMLTGVRQIPDTAWFVAAQAPLAEVLEPIDEARRAVLLIAGVALALALSVGLWAVGRIVRPIETLHRAASAINHQLGTGQVQLERARPAVEMLQAIHGRDEIGDLARMVVSLVGRLDTTLHSLKRASAEWERTFHAVADPVFCLDDEQRIARLNRAASNWLRESPNALVGKTVEDLLFGSTIPADWPRRESLQSADPQRGLSWRASLGAVEARTWEFSSVPVHDGEGRRVGAILVARDVTEQLLEEERIRSLAFRDALTGLPNRLLLADRLHQALQGAKRDGLRVALMFLDLDRFKEVNDTLGHEAGDRLLEALAARIQACLRSGDTLARLGGDEFVVVLPNVVAVRDAISVADKLLAVVASPFHIAGSTLRMSVSIGIAIYPDGAGDPEQLMRAADAAMYRAKQAGRNTYRVCDAPEPVH
jgi:diguanylate cyclase (GGDEF)-like protein